MAGRRWTRGWALAVSVLAVLGLVCVVGIGATGGRLTAHATRPAPVAAKRQLRQCLVRRPNDRREHAARGGLVIIGASYTAGLGAQSPRQGYATDLAARLHRPVRVYGVAGTGFLNPGPRDQGTFADRLVRIPARPTPGLVLIQGGRDDTQFSIAAELAAARRTLCLAEHHFSGARLAVLGPVPAHLPVTGKVLQIDAALRAACRDEHAIYIDALQQHWIDHGNVGRYAGHVPGHPNDAGYRYIAERAARDLGTAA